jgi:hypothetical protein
MTSLVGSITVMYHVSPPYPVYLPPRIACTIPILPLPLTQKPQRMLYRKWIGRRDGVWSGEQSGASSPHSNVRREMSPRQPPHKL